MPEDQTTVISKTTTDAQVTTSGPIDSKLFNFSVRSIIAIMLCGTVCLISIANAVLVWYDPVYITKIEEPLYSAFMVAVGAYLGSQTSRKVGL